MLMSANKYWILILNKQMISMQRINNIWKEVILAYIKKLIMLKLWPGPNIVRLFVHNLQIFILSKGVC